MFSLIVTDQNQLNSKIFIRPSGQQNYKNSDSKFIFYETRFYSSKVQVAKLKSSDIKPDFEENKKFVEQYESVANTQTYIYIYIQANIPIFVQNAHTENKRIPKVLEQRALTRVMREKKREIENARRILAWACFRLDRDTISTLFFSHNAYVHRLRSLATNTHACTTHAHKFTCERASFARS